MSIEFKIDLNASGRAFPHYWEYCVGSCHAATLLREDVRNHIRQAHKDCGFTHVRCHGLFDDDMSVYFGSEKDTITTSFYNIDCIYDFLLEIGMKPFVEIGFMPNLLASGTQTCFHYKGNVTPPADYEKWDDLIHKFAEHLIERYGKEEVEEWPFEVWNEPNLNFFFDGTQEQYFELYEHTARALKSVDDKLKTGGPATSANSWIPQFISYCKENDVPLDFVSTHHYPSDDPLSTLGMNGPGIKGGEIDEAFFLKENKNPRDILLKMTEKAKKEAGSLPLYYTEWNGSKEYDSSYQAAFVMQALSYNEGLVEGYSFWTVSDIFEESGMLPGPFKNAFGMQTNHGIPKPSYRAFQILHEAGEERIDVDSNNEADKNVEAFALKKVDEVMVIVYNHDLERRTVKPENVKVSVEGKIVSVQKAVIDEEHCNPLRAWIELGKPPYLNKEQENKIREASELVYEDVQMPDNSIAFTALEESITVLKIKTM